MLPVYLFSLLPCHLHDDYRMSLEKAVYGLIGSCSKLNNKHSHLTKITNEKKKKKKVFFQTVASSLIFALGMHTVALVLNDISPIQTRGPLMIRKAYPFIGWSLYHVSSRGQ